MPLFNMRLSAAERDRWAANARAKGLSTASWIRSLVGEAELLREYEKSHGRLPRCNARAA